MEQKKPQLYADIWKNGMKGCYYGSDAELIEQLSHVNESIKIRLLDEINLIRTNDDLHLIMTTEEVPTMALIGFGLLGDSLCIEPNLYQRDPKQYESLIIKVIESMQCDTLSIEPEINLSDDILFAIVRNNNIKTVSLGKRLLTSDIYSILKTKQSIEIMCDNVAEELQEIYDGTIYDNLYRKIVDDYNYTTLQRTKNLNLSRVYSEQELDKIFKYASSLESITIEGNSLSCLREIMMKIIDSNVEVTLRLDERCVYDIENLKEINELYPAIKVKYGTGTGLLADYIKAEAAILEMLKPIEGLDLSPLEKFIYAFNTCKRFREYKENEEDRMNARSIIELFKEGNKHIVCVGFANILSELCKRLDISITDVGLTVYSISSTNEVKRLGSHARNFVRINDPKYGLDNMYMTDATWSNDFEFDSLVTSLMTPYETLQLRSIVQFGETSIVSAQTYEEFLHSVFVEFRTGKHYNFDKTLEYLENLYPELREEFLTNQSYKLFKSKPFPNIEDYRLLYSDDSFMNKMFQLIKEKANQPISGEVLIAAAVNLYQKQYPNLTKEDVELYRKKLIEDNYHVYNRQVPPIVTEYSDGSKIITENEQNKFGQGPRKI